MTFRVAPPKFKMGDVIHLKNESSISADVLYVGGREYRLKYRDGSTQYCEYSHIDRHYVLCKQSIWKKELQDIIDN